MAASILQLADGAALSVHIDGSGPDLLLVSGLGGAAAFWQAPLDALAQHYRVIRYDQRGIAASSRGTAPVTIDQLADDSFAVLDHANSRRALLVGHSTGGVILQTMALRDETRIGGLVLSGTWLKPNRYMTELFTSRLAMLHVAPREYAAAAAFVGYPADWLDANWTTYEAMLASAPMTQAQQAIVAERIRAILQYDRSTQVGRIGVPQLIQGAEDDLIVPVFLQRELARALPRAETHFFKSGGHFFPITRTKEFVGALVAWAQKALR